MSKRLLIAGASGMVGREILNQALLSSEVSEVISFVRKKSDENHPKLKEVIVNDFSNYSELSNHFKNIDSAYFCIGVYTGQVPDAQFKVITVDYAVAFAQQLKDQSPQVRLCLLSGTGADRTEKSKTSFALYKGMMENIISTLKLEFYSFRPGYIYPVEARNEPNFIYKLMRMLYPLLKLFGNRYSIRSTQLAQAMFGIGLMGFNKEILENIDIVNFIKRNP